MSSTYLRKAVDNLGSQLTPAEELIGDYFIEHERELAHVTLSELAKVIGYSESTIYKFVKRLGFRGFPDFKIKIALNTKEEDQKEQEVAFHAEDDEVIKARGILQSYLNSFENLSLNFPAQQLQRAVDLLRQAKTVHLIGEGASKALALDAYHLLGQTELHVNFIFDYQIELHHLNKFSPEDVFLLFSLSEHSEDLLLHVRELDKTGAKIIVMTENPNSEFVHYAEACFIASTFYCEERLARGVYLTLNDILYTCVTSY